MTSNRRRNVALLAFGQGLFVCSQTTMIFLGAIVGYSLADDKSLATVPVSAVILGVASGTIPASLWMRRVGRRLGFMTGGAFGVVGSAICAAAVYQSSFPLFCLGSFLVGWYNAFCMYYRFAAADSSEPAFRPKAISLVLAGGIVAAFVGPELAVKTRDLLPPVAFLGSYLALAALGLVAVALASFLRIPDLTAEERRDSGRPLLQIMRQRAFIVAVISSMIGYAVMSFTMTATPLAMVACGFQHMQAGTVIQWHVLGMFAPSFFTGHLIARFGLYKIMLAGAMLLSAAAGIAVAGVEFANFWAALLVIGVGWNFLFVGATALLTQAHTPAERAKTQAANDFLVFASTATASFLSGKLLHAFGWETINLLTLPFALASAALVLWFALQAKRAPKAA